MGGFAAYGEHGKVSLATYLTYVRSEHPAEGNAMDNFNKHRPSTATR